VSGRLRSASDDAVGDSESSKSRPTVSGRKKPGWASGARQCDTRDRVLSLRVSSLRRWIGFDDATVRDGILSINDGGLIGGISDTAKKSGSGSQRHRGDCPLVVMLSDGLGPMCVVRGKTRG
jgi:hypothetical protein